MLTTRQYPRPEGKFDRAALIKSDLKSQFDAFAVARQNGWMSSNDILRKLDENLIPGKAGNAYLVQR